jgi:hypothetical protein
MVLEAQAYNPSYYLGGRVQEDQGLKPSQANSSRDPITQHKKRVQVVERLPCKCEALSSNPSTAQNSSPQNKNKKTHHQQHRLARCVGNKCL